MSNFHLRNRLMTFMTRDTRDTSPLTMCNRRN